MIDAFESVILVDVADRPLGSAPKLDVHRSGELHRAFSILVHDGDGRLLLQKRHGDKYHSGGLWTNTCCGHPRPGEETAAAACRRLEEEMGFTCPLVLERHLVYRADVGNGLTEHEFVHLFIGCWRGAVRPNPSEVEQHSWAPIKSVARGVTEGPRDYTAWFPLYLDDLWRIAARPAPRRSQ